MLWSHNKQCRLFHHLQILLFHDQVHLQFVNVVFVFVEFYMKEVKDFFVPMEGFLKLLKGSKKLLSQELVLASGSTCDQAEKLETIRSPVFYL